MNNATASSSLTSSQHRHLEREYSELQRKYDSLTIAIDALDTDISRTPEHSRRRPLEQQRADLAVEREQVVSRMAQIELQLKRDSAQAYQGTEPAPPAAPTPSPTASPLAPAETAPQPSVPPPMSAETTPSPTVSSAPPKPGCGRWFSRLTNASKPAVKIGLFALIFAVILVGAALFRASQDVTILNLHNGDRVPYRISVLGEYPAGMKDTIRIFIAPRFVRGVPPSTFFPQSYNPCKDNDGAVMQKERWEQLVFFGTDSIHDPGLRFDVVVATVSNEGDATVVDEIQRWCDQKEWWGFTDLPAGVSEVARITVTRSNELLRAPDPSGVQLPGLVDITSLGDGQTVKNSQVISGTYSNLPPDHTIWTLVYTTWGKWLPQSSKACAGRHTVAANGQWQVTSSFTTSYSGEPFDVVAVVADPAAGAFFDQKQREWCAQATASPDFKWPGLLTIELPQGITEKDRIQVVHE